MDPEIFTTASAPDFAVITNASTIKLSRKLLQLVTDPYHRQLVKNIETKSAEALADRAECLNLICETNVSEDYWKTKVLKTEAKNQKMQLKLDRMLKLAEKAEKGQQKQPEQAQAGTTSTETKAVSHCQTEDSNLQILREDSEGVNIPPQDSMEHYKVPESTTH